MCLRRASTSASAHEGPVCHVADPGSQRRTQAMVQRNLGGADRERGIEGLAFDLDGGFLLAAGVMVLSAAMGTVAGFGIALLLSPVLAILYDPITAVLTVTTFGVFNAVIALSGDTLIDPRPRAYSSDLFRLWCGAALATIPTALLLTRLPQRLITGALSLFVLASATLILRGYRPQLAGRRGTAVGAGALSQFANVLSGVGGPPIILYALASDWEPLRTRTTQQMYSVPVNIITVITVSLATDARAVWPLVVLGGLTTVAVLPIRARIASRTVYRLILMLALAAGVLAGIRALLG